jgi:anti-sigma regulatory factor (Ser/Thr protein kinase)
MPLTATCELSATFRLDRHPAEIARTRALTRQALADWGLSDHADLAQLIITELATNALQHGAGPIHVRLSYFSGDLWTEVHDDSPARPIRPHPPPEAEHGRGLPLLDALIALHGGAAGVVDDLDTPGKTVYVGVSVSEPL